MHKGLKTCLFIALALLLSYGIVTGEIVKTFTGYTSTASGVSSAYNAKSIGTISSATSHYRVYGGSLKSVTAFTLPVVLKCAVNTAAGIVDNNTILFRLDNVTAATYYEFGYNGNYVTCPDNASIILQVVGDNTTSIGYNVVVRETREKDR